MATKRRTKRPRAVGRASKGKTASRKLARTDDFIGRLKGQFQIVGDITEPVYPPEAWTGDIENIDKEPDRQS